MPSRWNFIPWGSGFRCYLFHALIMRFLKASDSGSYLKGKCNKKRTEESILSPCFCLVELNRIELSTS